MTHARRSVAVIAMCFFASAAQAADRTLRVDDSAPATRTFTRASVARSADVISGLQSYFRGEAAPSGADWKHLVDSFKQGAVQYADAEQRKSVDLAIARLAASDSVVHPADLEAIVMASRSGTVRAELEAQRQRTDLSAEARARIRHLLIRFVR
jgi:hypothetical protein